jgi:hypothetical protein
MEGQHCHALGHIKLPIWIYRCHLQTVIVLVNDEFLVIKSCIDILVAKLVSFRVSTTVSTTVAI